jgi:hypothetical protein
LEALGDSYTGSVVLIVDGLVLSGETSAMIDWELISETDCFEFKNLG